MIIEYYQGKIPYEELQDKLGATKNGISAYQLIEYSKRIGFEAKGIEGSFETLKNEQIIFPCIAHIVVQKSYYHYIVLYEMNIKKQYFVVGDPARGIYKMTFESFECMWNQIIITFFPKTPITYIEPNHILKDYFLEKIKQEKHVIITIIFLSFLITVVAILNTTLLNHFISLLDKHDEFLFFIISIVLYFSFIILKNYGSYFRNKIFLHVYQKIDFEFMKLIFHQILYLPYRYYKNRTTGDMISRIDDISVIRTFLANITLSSVMDFPLIIISGICLYFIEEKLFFLILIVLILYASLFNIYQKIISKKVEQVEEENAKTTSYMIESLNGYETFFGSHLKPIIEKRFAVQYLQTIDSVKKLEEVQNQKQLLNQMLFDGSTLAILSFGIWFVSKEQSTISEIILFHSLFLYFIDPIRNLLLMNEEWKKVKISWRRLSHLFHPSKEIGIYDRRLNGDIELQNVNFSYPNQKTVLQNVNLQIHASTKVLITGKSGSGKSTILKLLMKYYEKTSGNIKIDQTKIEDYKQETIDKNILYVSMKEQLFTGPLCQNISIDEKYDESYQEIVQLTEVDAIIKDNPLGHYLSLEENGANLSGGERQRVVLARTLLLPFEILLLDEATSQMDINMERRILKRIFKKFPDKTILIISHRVENADLFDEWIEIENGKIKKDVKKYE